MDLTMSISGWIATILLLIAFGPQSYKVCKAKSAEGVSKITFPIVFLGSAMWTIYTSFNASIQPWICNTVIVFMMIPTIYYIFKEQKITLILVLLAGLAITLAALILLILVKSSVIADININWLSWVFVILAGAGTTVSYLPQMFHILKTKKIGNVSTLTLTIISIGNVMWIIFWTLKFQTNSFDGTFVTSIVFSVMGFLYQLPVIYLYIKQNRKVKK